MVWSKTLSGVKILVIKLPETGRLLKLKQRKPGPVLLPASQVVLAAGKLIMRRVWLEHQPGQWSAGGIEILQPALAGMQSESSKLPLSHELAVLLAIGCVHHQQQPPSPPPGAQFTEAPDQSSTNNSTLMIAHTY